MIRIRPSASVNKARFLALAAHEDNVEVVLSNPKLARYIEDFGRDGDTAVVAEDDETRATVGVAWARFWTRDNCGFGFVDEATPELAVAVEEEFRGRGIGARLIEALLAQLRASQDIEQVSLNVRADSRAVALYERLGFVKIEGSERTNRTGGISFNMIAR